MSATPPSGAQRPGLLAALVAAAAIALAAAIFGLTAVTAGAEQPDPGPGFGPGPVTAHTPRTEVWAAASEELSAGIDPEASASCLAGELECLDAVLAEMEARLQEQDCAHTAVFALTYLEMTRAVRERAARQDFFDNPSAVAQFDALFAEIYFDAFDNWRAGRREEVPPAWQIAFAAADDRRVSASADVLLGMNAHISRDLAYAIALAREGDLDYGRADFFLVDEVIDTVQETVIPTLAERFDPAVAMLDDMLVASEADVDTTGLISLWRGRAFDQGRRLAAAPNAAARDAVAAEIERTALAAAALVLNLDATRPLGLGPAARARHCEQHSAR